MKDRLTLLVAIPAAAFAATALLAGCGGGAEGSTQSQREQDALQQALQLNSDALNRRVVGERSFARAGDQQ
jgi:hypothetical protein